MIVPLNDTVAPNLLLGVLLCFRNIIPKLGEADDGAHTMKGSFGVKSPGSSDKGSSVDVVDESKLLKVCST